MRWYKYRLKRCNMRKVLVLLLVAMLAGASAWGEYVDPHADDVCEQVSAVMTSYIEDFIPASETALAEHVHAGDKVDLTWWYLTGFDLAISSTIVDDLAWVFTEYHYVADKYPYLDEDSRTVLREWIDDRLTAIESLEKNTEFQRAAIAGWRGAWGYIHNAGRPNPDFERAVADLKYLSEHSYYLDARDR
jgi:hypothetical protein